MNGLFKKSFFKQSKTTFWFFIVVVLVALLSPYFNKSFGWIITIPALVLLGLPYLRFSQYRHTRFRLLNLSSILLFTLIFSQVDKVSCYIFTTVALGIWFTTKEDRTIYDKVLIFVTLIFLFLPNYFSNSIQDPDLLSFLLLIPSILVWIQILFELITFNFGYEGLGIRKTVKPQANLPIDVVLPIYNPYDGFEETIKTYFNQLISHYPQRQFRLFISNDGSTKNFGQDQIKKLKEVHKDVIIVDNPENNGKGYTLRKGIGCTNAPLVVYTDYDFPFTVQSMINLIAKLDDGYDVVIGTRDRSYQGVLPLLRKLYSTFSHYLNSFFLGLKYNDTQGGLKGFNTKGREVFMNTEVKEFLFDTEFIYRTSLDTSLIISDVLVSTREGIAPSNMGFKIIAKECINFTTFLKI